MAFKKWTEADYNTLRDLYQRGIAVKTIAEILGRSERAVLWKVSEEVSIKRQRNDPQGRPQRRQYLDCIPNPFKHCKIKNFDKNFYRHL